MTNQVNRDDLETAILDVVRKMNIDNAIHSVPVYSLKEILELKNVTTLRKIGKELHIKYYSKLSKQELIPAISEQLIQTDNLRNCRC